jgi:hypothetical protein
MILKKLGVFPKYSERHSCGIQKDFSTGCKCKNGTCFEASQNNA